ncbi:MAG: exodeoxyribonuclease VII small subunit [Kangiellaceae bacterium]
MEQIVQSLEDGELTLEQSLTQFEKGVKLTRECQSILDTAEQKVSVLTAGKLEDANLD